MTIGTAIRRMPVVGRIYGLLRPVSVPEPVEFVTSGDYWEKRYATGGHSGAGSYGRLARFKADFLNAFVAEHGVRSVIEFGSGDGAQLALARYPSYIGVDVSRTVLEETRRRFAKRGGFRFLHVSEVTPAHTAELSLSLDVIYHLVEDMVFDTYMRDLFAASTRWVIVFASDEDKPWPVPHVRHRAFSRWVERQRPDFRLVSHTPNPYPWDANDVENTSFADFFVFEKRG